MNIDTGNELEQLQTARYVHPEDKGVVGSLLRAGIPKPTVAHTLQLPLSTIEAWGKEVETPAKQTVPICKLFYSSEHGERYAASKSDANEQVHGRPVPRWWAAEFGFEREQRSDPQDALWEMQSEPTQGSQFLTDRGARCPVCKKTLYRKQRHSYSQEEACDISEPVGATVTGFTPQDEMRIEPRTPCEVVWGVAEVVCSGCWGEYEGGVNELLRRRRERVMAYVEGHAEKVRKAAEPSELEQLCSRLGVEPRNLWVPLKDEKGKQGDLVYYRVESIAGGKANISKPVRKRSRTYTMNVEALERLLVGKRFVNAEGQPLYQSELSKFCDELGVLESSVVMSVKGSEAKAAFLRDGVVWFSSPTLPAGRYYTYPADEIRQRVKTGQIKAVAQIRLNLEGGKTRWPCASDDDLRGMGTELAGSMPARERLEPRRFRSGMGEMSAVSVWQHLARVAEQIGEDGWAECVRKNVKVLLSARSDGEHCLAGFLLYLLTVERSSVLGKPVLQKLYNNARYEHLFEPLIDDWWSADALLQPYGSVGKKLKLARAFV